MKHTIVAWMEDTPGVLNRVASLFRRRNFNIESLSVGHSETPGISRMTFVVEGDARELRQVQTQLFKLINVTAVEDVTDKPSIVRELVLVKVAVTGATRGEVMQLAQIYRARIVDVALNSVVIQITGDRGRVDSFVDLLKHYGIMEMGRTGQVAMVRGEGQKPEPVHNTVS